MRDNTFSRSKRILIDDDKHGRSDRGTFKFEGGFYAKTIELSSGFEPQIFTTTSNFATVVENMLFDPETKNLYIKDDSLTANMRCACPLDYIANASEAALGGHPKNVIKLKCNVFGVLPSIERLSPAQAMYHFLPGFTSKFSKIEWDILELEPTISTCFGAPFMPRRSEVYRKLMRDKIARYGATCWLANSGWTDGPNGQGTRMPIKTARALLTSTLRGYLCEKEFRKDEYFRFQVPISVADLNRNILHPCSTRSDRKAYYIQTQKLVDMFARNILQWVPFVDEDVKAVFIGLY